MAKRSDDPRTVTVTHPDQGDHKVTPEVAAVLERQGKGWVRKGAAVDDIGRAVEKATAPLKARIAELEAQLAAHHGDEVPDGNVDEVIAWIGQDPDRARAAADVEQARPQPRTTVTGHIESVLATSNTNDQADPAKED